MAHPTNYKPIMKLQQGDKSLLETAKKNKKFKIKQCQGAGKNYSLICLNDKIVVHKYLQRRMVQWYNCTITELTISQHFYWKNLRKPVHDNVNI